MHRLFCPITPQKRTHSRLPAEEHLLSPMPNAPLPLPSQRKNNHLELLLSPSPVHRDLFSQLLATAKPPPSPASLLMDEEYDELDCLSMREEEESCCEESSELDDSSEGEEEGVKKRKRKSTAQIKMLKQELEEEPNWSKEKIVEMSDLTGLSQSQVYKWWWDQKKKTAPRTASSSHNRDPLAQLMLKRKQIRKDFSRRPSMRECDKENGFGYQIEESAVATKVKANVEMEQLQDTERKVNKRLIFS